MCTLKLRRNDQLVIQTTDGAQYVPKITGCGEALAIFDLNGNYITAVDAKDFDIEDTAQYNTAVAAIREHEYEELDVTEIPGFMEACAALTSIKMQGWLSDEQRQEKLQALKDQVAARMEEQGIEGKVFA